MSFELICVSVLVALAFGDLIVGVVNDAVNFLNSALGSKVSSSKVIFAVASVGLLIGASFSDGIIEVARKGIFSPELFSTTEIIMVFTAVALADILLLDLYSTFGIPTSTTVTLIFELMGASVVGAYFHSHDFGAAWGVLNSESVLKIIVGIVMSVGLALTLGFLVQFLTRLFFTFDYEARFRRWGFLWCGLALSFLMYYVLIKGGAHSSFMTPDLKDWISNNTTWILGGGFLGFSLVSGLCIRLGFPVLKGIVLLGTAALAMAFAGNDLANFIGVSIGGVHAFLGADLSSDTLHTPAWVLLLAGLVMCLSMIFSKKALTVAATEIHLSSHGSQVQKDWKPHPFLRGTLEMIKGLTSILKSLVPTSFLKWTGQRIGYGTSKHSGEGAEAHFDLLRASVNLMLAAALISFATSYKLPLSTTYVTFTVAMGTALADGAWNDGSASHRLAGVLTVVGSWFLTAVLAFSMAGVVSALLFQFQAYGLALLLPCSAFLLYRLSRIHSKRMQAA